MGQAKTFTIVPRAGRGMITSRNFQTLQEYTDSFRQLSNVYAKDGDLVYRPAEFTVGALAAGPTWGIHFYNFIDTTSASATVQTIEVTLEGGATDYTGTAKLYRSDAGGAISVNGNDFAATSPFDVMFLNIKNRCFVAARSAGANTFPSILARIPSIANYKWGVDPSITDLSYIAFTNATNTSSKSWWKALDANVATGSTNISRAGATVWDTVNWIGKTVYLNAVPYTIVTVPTNATATISPAYIDATPPSPVDMLVHYGEISWVGDGPSYAIAYYNPTTGHISNHGPVMTVSEPDGKNVRICIDGIKCTDDAQYTRIVLFRTLLNGGTTLLPLKLDPSHAGSATIDNTPGSAGRYMIVNSGTGTVTYHDALSDAYLQGQILGGLEAPTINNAPPSDIKYMAYWDGRVWFTTVSSPFRLQFSGNASQIPLGVAEECFPAVNYRDVTSDDSVITGLKVVGPSLLVCTERFIYTVDGDSESYKLVRVSSRGSGINQWAIDEHPGDSSEQAASAVYFARDLRLWRQYPGGKIEDIGWPIQDKLDLVSLNIPRPIIIKVIQTHKSWMLACGIKYNGSYNYLFYDFDEQMWFDAGMAFDFFANGYANMWVPVESGCYYSVNQQGMAFNEFANTSGTRLALMTDPSVHTGFPAIIETQDLDMGSRTALKSLQAVNIHSTTTGTDDALWTVKCAFNGTNTYVDMVRVPDANSPRYAGTGVMRFVPNTAVSMAQWHAVRVRTTMVTSGSTPAPRFHKMAIAYTIESTGISGSANV